MQHVFLCMYVYEVCVCVFESIHGFAKAIFYHPGTDLTIR